jgi:PBP1b-binding outer membrane lipoprotein LpoB
MRKDTVILIAAMFWLGCSSEPFTRVANGDWSDAGSALMTVTSSGASIREVCENDVIDQPLTVGSSGDFDWTGTTTAIGNVVGASSHPAEFTGHATQEQIVLTRTITDGSFTVVTHTFVRGSTSFTPCPAATPAR